MNASDDRSIDALKDMISRSMANNTLNSFTESGESRPNCLILDEIDGMDGRGPIDALVSIIKTPLQFHDSTSKKKVSKGRIALTRPLICICNDQYSPILKELRGVAKVFSFSPPTEIRLVQRLKSICQQESLGNISTTALTALCQSCNGDIRSAINTLQFAALKCSHNQQLNTSSPSPSSSSPTKARGRVEGVDASYEVSHILTTMLLSGSKDERQDIFKLWRNIFTVHDSDLVTKRLSLLSAVQQMKTSMPPPVTSMASTLSLSSRPAANPRQYQTYRSSNAMEIFDAVSSYSENQLVMQGIHENYLMVRYTDPTIQRTCLAADWLSIGDIFEGRLYSGEMNSHSTSMYLPTVASAIHLICATDTKGEKLQFPSKVVCSLSLPLSGSLDFSLSLSLPDCLSP
jgi:chromosome transmission fidelity protein 18